MRNKITLEISICQAENGFSLDELVKKVADAYEKKAFAEHHNAHCHPSPNVVPQPACLSSARLFGKAGKSSGSYFSHKHKAEKAHQENPGVPFFLFKPKPSRK